MLTYTTGKLTWDSATGVDPNGAAELSLFSATYNNLLSENDDNVVAPGTEGLNILRLKNDTARTIQYVAVMYRIKEESTLPVAPVLTGSGFTDTTEYPLPDGVTGDQVVRAVTGTVRDNEIQDFDINWLWDYYKSDSRDIIDTNLGNKAAWATADEVTSGLYIVVVEDYDPSDPDDPDDDYVYPQVPKTGDDYDGTRYLMLMAFSGVLAIFIAIELRRGRQCERP